MLCFLLELVFHFQIRVLQVYNNHKQKKHQAVSQDCFMAQNRGDGVIFPEQMELGFSAAYNTHKNDSVCCCRNYLDSVSSSEKGSSAHITQCQCADLKLLPFFFFFKQGDQELYWQLVQWVTVTRGNGLDRYPYITVLKLSLPLSAMWS